MKLTRKETRVPCKICLVVGICSELCPEIEKMLEEDMRPIIEEMELALREEKEWKTHVKVV